MYCLSGSLIGCSTILRQRQAAPEKEGRSSFRGGSQVAQLVIRRQTASNRKSSSDFRVRAGILIPYRPCFPPSSALTHGDCRSHELSFAVFVCCSDCRFEPRRLRSSPSGEVPLYLHRF